MSFSHSKKKGSARVVTDLRNERYIWITGACRRTCSAHQTDIIDFGLSKCVCLCFWHLNIHVLLFG